MDADERRNYDEDGDGEMTTVNSRKRTSRHDDNDEYDVDDDNDNNNDNNDNDEDGFISLDDDEDADIVTMQRDDEEWLRWRPQDVERAQTDAALAAFFSERHDLRQLGAHGTDGGRVEVFCGDGPDHIDYDDARLAALDLVHKPRAGEKPYNHVHFEKLLPHVEGRRLLTHLRQALAPLLDVGYRVLDVIVVARVNDDNPWHQDKQTGTCVFLRRKQNFSQGQRVALRLLWDLGAFPNSDPDAREMRYRLRDGTEVLSTRHRFVAMDANAAGSQMQSNVEHARFGDGITVSVDLSLQVSPSARLKAAQRATGKRFGHSLSHKRNPLGSQLGAYMNSGDLLCAKPQHMDTLQRESDIRARFAREAQQAQRRAVCGAGPGESNVHCWRCGSFWTATDKWYNGTRIRMPTVRLCHHCNVYGHQLSLVARHRRKYLDLLRNKQQRFAQCPVDCAGCSTNAPVYAPPQPLGFNYYAEQRMDDAIIGLALVLHCYHCRYHEARNFFDLPANVANGGRFVRLCDPCSCKYHECRRENLPLPERVQPDMHDGDDCVCMPQHKTKKGTTFLKQAIKRSQLVVEQEHAGPRSKAHCWFCGGPPFTKTRAEVGDSYRAINATAPNSSQRVLLCGLCVKAIDKGYKRVAPCPGPPECTGCGREVIKNIKFLISQIVVNE